MTIPEPVVTKDFLRFVGADAQGLIDKEKRRITVDSLKSFAEWYFAGFTRITGVIFSEEYRSEVYWVWIALNLGCV